MFSLWRPGWRGPVIGSGGSCLHASAARFSVPARGRPADKGAQIAAVAAISVPFLMQQGIPGPWHSTFAGRRKAKVAGKPRPLPQSHGRTAGKDVRLAGLKPPQLSARPALLRHLRTRRKAGRSCSAHSARARRCSGQDRPGPPGTAPAAASIHPTGRVATIEGRSAKTASHAASPGRPPRQSRSP